jgi:hypothetical protein
VPVVVPNIPMFVLGHDNDPRRYPDMAGAAQGVTPVQFGSISRIGSSIYGMAPGHAGTPPETDLESAWGFMAGKAPPGTSALTVAANGTTFIRGNCYAYSGGHASASGGICAFVEEFVPVGTPVLGTSVYEHDPSLSSITHDHETVAEIDPGPSLAWTGVRAYGAWTVLLNLTTAVLGWQVSVLDTHPAATMLVTPVTPGNWYRWWIASYQYAGVATPGAAVSNIAFDFGPVFYAFT